VKFFAYFLIMFALYMYYNVPPDEDVKYRLTVYGGGGVVHTKTNLEQRDCLQRELYWLLADGFYQTECEAI